jgi:hypothetical protein
MTLAYAARGDGKVLNASNAWISKHFVKSTLQYIYWVNILDLTGSTNTYTLQFSSSGLNDIPPGAVTNLAAAAASGGSLGLNWSAPGEDGYTGYLFGGHYFLDAELSSAAFSPTRAQVSFTTSTAPGAAQYYTDTGLAGNATYYVALFTQDTGGNMSALSNVATGYTLPNPPTSLYITSVATGSLASSWSIGNNNLPIAYRMSLSTQPAGPAVFSSPPEDSFMSTFTFKGLTPNTSYYLSGSAVNPVMGTASPPAWAGSTVTLAALPGVAPFGEVTPSSAVVRWALAGNPADTLFWAELSTMPGHSPVLAASGWVAGSSTVFTGLSLGTTYYAQVKASNRAQVATAYTSLGSFVAAPFTDILPPRTALVAGAPSFSSATVYATDGTTFTLTAVDDADHVGDGAGLGVAQTFIAVDTTTFSSYTGAFSLTGEGQNTVSYYSVDLANHTEAVHSTTVDIDLTPPVSSLQVLGSSITMAQGITGISVADPVALSAIDPVSNGVASGVNTIYYVVDADPFSPACAAVPLDPNQLPGTCANEAYNGPFTLSGGTHTVYWFAEDNVGNQEAEHVSTFTVDALPPRTTLAWGLPSFSSAPYSYVTNATTFNLTAVDDYAAVGDGVGLGVAQTLVAVDTTTFSVYTGAFDLPAEGLHTISYHSVDMGGNVEVVGSTSVAVDLTSPVTSLQAQGATTTDSQGNLTVSTVTLLALFAVDPVSNGVASGVGATSGLLTRGRNRCNIRGLVAQA